MATPINVPKDVWKEIVKYCNVPRLKICTEYSYGELFGRNDYVGFPISLNIKIHINNPTVYFMITYHFMIDNTLNILYSYERLYSDSYERYHICTDTELTIDTDNDFFASVGIIRRSENIYEFGKLHIKLTQDQITTFMNQYIAVLKKFQAKCRQLMIGRKKTINPDEKTIGFYAN